MVRGLSVDEETVRNRLKHMKDVGFLQEWQLILNPVLHAGKAAIVDLGVNNTGSKMEIR